MLKQFKNITKKDLQAAFGVFISIGAVSAVSISVEHSILLAPFGATSVIAFLTHSSEFAAPRNIIGGYVVTSIAGVGIAFFLGHSWWTYALGVALALLLKRIAGVVHPPSAAMPIILINTEDGRLLDFAICSVLPGLIVLVAVAILYNRYLLGNKYPVWK